MPSARREQRAERLAEQSREQRLAQRSLGVEGERPQGPFGGLPVSEIAIFAGLVGLGVWFASGRGATPLLIVSLAVIGLAVLEVICREHFSGYRSHATLLSAIPSMAIGIAVVSLIGEQSNRAPLLVAVAGPLFAGLLWLTRRRFKVARQERVVSRRRG